MAAYGSYDACAVRSKVGFGVSEAVRGFALVELECARDVCARTVEVGMRCCEVYLEAQNI